MEKNEVERGLSGGEIEMIGVGGRIGVGVLMGGRSRIKWRGG